MNFYGNTFFYINLWAQIIYVVQQFASSHKEFFFLLKSRLWEIIKIFMTIPCICNWKLDQEFSDKNSDLLWIVDDSFIIHTHNIYAHMNSIIINILLCLSKKKCLCFKVALSFTKKESSIDWLTLKINKERGKIDK